MRYLALIAIALPLAGADVKINFDHAAPFASYHTFAFAQQRDPGPQYFDVKRLEESVVRELSKHGFTEVEARAKPDVMVRLNAHTGQRREVDSTPGMVRYGPYGPVVRSGRRRVSYYPIEKLAVVLIDRLARNPIWRADIRFDAVSPEKADREIAKTVEKAFRKYPPS